MTVVVRQGTGGQIKNEAAIYATDVIDGGETCTGNQVDIVNIGQVEGWVCLAVEATDSVGNVGISAPVPVCLDDETASSQPDCAKGAIGPISTALPPSCTDGCTPPSRSL